MKSIDKERIEFLKNELEEYEKITPMTEDERVELHKWVAEGHSVYENGCMAVWEGNRPCEFLEVYRDIEETRAILDSLPARERENYIARLNGVDTIDNLREDLEQELFRTSIYEKVLRSHGLLEEANQLFHKRIEESNALMSEWTKNHPDEELPFD